MTVDDPADDVRQVVLGIDGVELAGFDQRRDDRPVLATAVGAGEECVLSVQGNRPDGSLDDVAIDLDPPVIDEEHQALPTRQSVADSLGKPGRISRQRTTL